MLTPLYEYGSIEWLWQDSAIRVNLPNKEEKRSAGSYQEIIEVQTQLGQQGWEIITATAGSNWIYWTIKRPTTS